MRLFARGKIKKDEVSTSSFFIFKFQSGFIIFVSHIKGRVYLRVDDNF
jgi:hypothetical protein